MNNELSTLIDDELSTLIDDELSFLIDGMYNNIYLYYLP